MPSLTEATDLLKLLADGSRVRLLALLEGEALTVAELTAVTGLSQSRVSSHLGRLREAGLLRPRREGASTYYAVAEGMPAPARALWTLVSGALRDDLLAEDRRAVRRVLQARAGSWAESVAGQMERHYAPGRTWESACRGLVGLAALGDVLDVASGDGALAELVAPRARSVTCLDLAARVVEAGRRRFAAMPHVRLARADMHALPFADASFDQVLLVNSLIYASDPERVVREVARVLRPGATVSAAVLRAHRHRDVVAAYDHVQPGFEPGALRAMVEGAGLAVDLCEVTCRERRPPHFAVVSVYAHRPAARARTARPRPRRRVAARAPSPRPSRRGP